MLAGWRLGCVAAVDWPVTGVDCVHHVLIHSPLCKPCPSSTQGLADGLRATEVPSAADMQAIRDEVNQRWEAVHPAPLALMRPAFILEQRHGDTVMVPVGW